LQNCRYCRCRSAKETSKFRRAKPAGRDGVPLCEIYDGLNPYRVLVVEVSREAQNWGMKQIPHKQALSPEELRMIDAGFRSAWTVLHVSGPYENWSDKEGLKLALRKKMFAVACSRRHRTRGPDNHHLEKFRSLRATPLRDSAKARLLPAGLFFNVASRSLFCAPTRRPFLRPRIRNTACSGTRSRRPTASD
jgi:hypothetical protein